MTVLVACVGNIFRGDDGFGCEVAKALTAKHLSPQVRVKDFGTRALDLTYALLDAPELTIIVDAVCRGGEPGTLYTIEPQLEATPQSHEMLNLHHIDPLKALRAAKAMGGALGRLLLVGCEPAELGGEEGRLGLTPAVSRVVPRAVEIVERLAATQQLTSNYDFIAIRQT